MNVLDLFTDFLFYTNINCNNQAVVEYILNNRNRLQDPVRHSENGNAWQTNKCKSLPNLDDVWYDLFNNVMLAINENSEKRSARKFKLLNYWFNITGENGYNERHVHPGSIFSCVYYLQVPENPGAISFYRNEVYTMSEVRKLSNDNNNNYLRDMYSHIPKTGDLLLFPAYLSHSVDKCESQGERITLAINFGYY